uniref:Uncharacterized protein n=1 Tax=viral metagenome TaxID=1070528 RepID=A0A6C0CIK0_9ZZZZ
MEKAQACLTSVGLDEKQFKISSSGILNGILEGNCWLAISRCLLYPDPIEHRFIVGYQESPQNRREVLLEYGLSDQNAEKIIALASILPEQYSIVIRRVKIA